VTTVDDLLAGSGRGVRMTTLDDGTEVVVKAGEPSAIAAEAAGLRWLAEPGVVGVPEVLGTSAGRMVSTQVPEGRPDPDAAARLGRGLAALHAAGAPAFGSPPPGGPVHAWIGDAEMVNETGEHWPSWYAEHRVLPYARRARDRGTFSADDVAVVERACARFDAVAGPAEPPARLHGDLWTGNVLWAGGQGWVIDPAAHGGHRETDLAMLALFGAPQLDTILAAYDEAAPLTEGWRDRVGLHQLFPLLVHTVLFGGGYGPRALEVCERLA
jgi:fructosamine-3-kinase